MCLLGGGPGGLRRSPGTGRPVLLGRKRLLPRLVGDVLVLTNRRHAGAFLSSRHLVVNDPQPVIKRRSSPGVHLLPTCRDHDSMTRVERDATPDEILYSSDVAVRPDKTIWDDMGHHDTGRDNIIQMLPLFRK